MVWFLRASIFALVGIVFLVWSLYNVPILYKVKFKCVNSSYTRSKSSFKTELYLRVILGPRGSQLGWEKQRGKFSIMGERAPGMLLRTNQFHKSFKCLSLIFLCAQSEASIYHAAFVIFLYRGVYLQNSTVHCTCLAHAGVIPRETENDILFLHKIWGANKVLGGVQITNPRNSFYSHPRTVFLGSSIL